MVGITQNKQVPCFYCGPLQDLKQQKQKGVGKSFKDSKKACKYESVN